MHQNLNFLRQTHGQCLLGYVFVLNALVMLNLAVGDIKPWVLINWLDGFGEGGAAIMALAWLVLILSSRPAGSITNLLSVGMFCMSLSLLQDALDEVIALPSSAIWETWVEAGAMPVGMVVLTWGLYLWRREQVAIMAQLRKRERIFRRHSCIDAITQIGGLQYLKDQLALEAKRTDRQSKTFALLLVDLDGFAGLNRTFGQQEGDRILHLVSELLILNLRDSDLVCRYSGDRYAILLPDTTLDQAAIMAEELTSAISHFAFRTLRGERVHLSASIGIAPYRPNYAIDDVLEKAKIALLHAKQAGGISVPQFS